MQSQDEPIGVAIVFLAALLPLAYGFLILWAFEYRFRMTTRNLLIATAVVATVFGIAVCAMR
jgi:hypothetical protein